MGELFYVVADETTSKGKRTFRYVCFGKQTELYINHKDLLVAFMLIKDSCDSFACDIKFIDGTDSFEREILVAFGKKAKDHVKNVSKEYLEYATEELELDSNWAIVKRTFESIAEIAEALKDPTLDEQHRQILQAKYGLVKHLIDGPPVKYPFKREKDRCNNCRKAEIGVSYLGEESYCKVRQCAYEPRNPKKQAVEAKAKVDD